MGEVMTLSRLVESSTIGEGAVCGPDTAIEFGAVHHNRVARYSPKIDPRIITSILGHTPRINAKYSRIEMLTSTHFHRPSLSPLFSAALGWGNHKHSRTHEPPLGKHHTPFLESNHQNRSKESANSNNEFKRTPLFALESRTHRGVHRGNNKALKENHRRKSFCVIAGTRIKLAEKWRTGPIKLRTLKNRVSTSSQTRETSRDDLSISWEDAEEIHPRTSDISWLILAFQVQPSRCAWGACNKTHLATITRVKSTTVISLFRALENSSNGRFASTSMLLHMAGKNPCTLQYSSNSCTHTRTVSTLPWNGGGGFLGISLIHKRIYTNRASKLKMGTSSQPGN